MMKSESFCLVCGKQLSGRQKKYCSRSCKNKDLQSYESQKRRGLERKQELVDEAGSCCSICGYRNNLAALVFHHTQPDGKDFKLDMRSLSNRTYKSVRIEIEKCVLLCANCHAEVHNPHLKR